MMPTTTITIGGNKKGGKLERFALYKKCYCGSSSKIPKNTKIEMETTDQHQRTRTSSNQILFEMEKYLSNFDLNITSKGVEKIRASQINKCP